MGLNCLDLTFCRNIYRITGNDEMHTFSLFLGSQCAISTGKFLGKIEHAHSLYFCAQKSGCGSKENPRKKCVFLLKRPKTAKTMYQDVV